MSLGLAEEMLFISENIHTFLTWLAYYNFIFEFAVLSLVFDAISDFKQSTHSCNLKVKMNHNQTKHFVYDILHDILLWILRFTKKYFSPLIGRRKLSQ